MLHEARDHSSHDRAQRISAVATHRKSELRMRKNRILMALGAFFLSTVPLFAQDTPVGPEGTQVATDQTQAAAVNTDALRNAAQNPVAALISVPIQENFNFNNRSE